MDTSSFEELVKLFADAHGRALFAADQARLKIEADKKQKVEDLQDERDKKEKIARSQISTDLVTRSIKLKENLQFFYQSSNDILQIAEYLEIGQLVSSSMVSLVSSLQSVPFIIPFFGHENISFFGKDNVVEDLEVQLVWRILSNSAPGQVALTIYNPSLKNNLSVFSTIPQASVITSAKDFTSFLSDLSNEILSVDKMLKGSNSLIELRKMSKQPVGNLRLVVLQDVDFLSDTEAMKCFSKVLSESPRVGIAFLCFCSDSNVQSFFESNKGTTVLKMNQDASWQVDNHHSIHLFNQDIHDLDNQIEEYIKRANETSVITIPFTTIESLTNMWTGNSASGIEFAMGKAGMDTISLKLGDSVTQCHNVLISGAAGKGKSNLLEIIVHSLCARYSPNELQLYLLDFKDGLTFKPYSDFTGHSYLPHAKVLGLESERDFGLATLEYLEGERKRRANLYKKSDCTGITTYRDKHPEAVMPRIVLIIDEFQKLFEVSDKLGTSAADLLENLVRQGRACGIHIILASQTIHGTAALMGREDKIYAQFPVRIALQNSLTESYATFVQGNDGAAKLRVRGEAIINENYGDINSNKRFTVAFADPEVMKTCRTSWCQSIHDNIPLPVVFRKDETCHITDTIQSIKNWRQQIVNGDSYPRLPCGFDVSVNKNIVSVRMSNDAGRNVAILGAGDSSQNPEPMSNNAIGMMECMALSIALQHINGDARFTFVNCLDKQKYVNNDVDNWLRAMERFGFPVDVVEKENAGAFFCQIAQTIDDNTADGNESHYIFCAALDRCTTLNQKNAAKTVKGFGISLEDPFAKNESTSTGVDAFQTILRNGSQLGIHVITWWTNATIYKEHIGLRGEGYINTKILLHLDSQTMQKILSNFSVQSMQDNRALIHDDTDLSNDITIVPYVPINNRDVGLLEAEAWDI